MEWITNMKTVLLTTATVAAVMLAGFWIVFDLEECTKEPYQQNQMVDGCVMQKSGGQWIKTCG